MKFCICICSSSEMTYFDSSNRCFAQFFLRSEKNVLNNAPKENPLFAKLKCFLCSKSLTHELWKSSQYNSQFLVSSFSCSLNFFIAWIFRMFVTMYTNLFGLLMMNSTISYQCVYMILWKNCRNKINNILTN